MMRPKACRGFWRNATALIWIIYEFMRLRYIGINPLGAAFAIASAMRVLECKDTPSVYVPGRLTMVTAP